jgi:hypothetical protein
MMAQLAGPNPLPCGRLSITIQAKLSGEFMKTPACKKGRVGSEFSKTMAV